MGFIHNIRDVEVEIGIQNKLSRFPVSEAVWDEYHLDQEINDRGVKLDLTLVKQSIEIDTLSKTKLSRALQDLTELENPNSVMQMKMWLSKHGIDTEDLGKKTVVKLKEGIESGDIYDALTLRQMLSKSSIKKYEAMKNAKELEKFYYKVADWNFWFLWSAYRKAHKCRRLLNP